jgi:hypothetical protein
MLCQRLCTRARGLRTAENPCLRSLPPLPDACRLHPWLPTTTQPPIPTHPVPTAAPSPDPRTDLRRSLQALYPDGAAGRKGGSAGRGCGTVASMQSHIPNLCCICLPQPAPTPTRISWNAIQYTSTHDHVQRTKRPSRLPKHRHHAFSPSNPLTCWVGLGGDGRWAQEHASTHVWCPMWSLHSRAALHAHLGHRQKGRGGTRKGDGGAGGRCRRQSAEWSAFQCV